MQSLIFSLVTVIVSFFILSQAATPSGACNNSPLLCTQAYNAITHLGAHDSPFVRDATTGNSESGDQYYNSTVQLASGVRLLTAQVHHSNNEWHLCHSSCDLLDAGTLAMWLAELKGWMDDNPNDVVTILLVNSDHATPSDLDGEFSTSGVKKYIYTPPSNTAPPATWPTLQELISASTRLMTFVASLDPSTTSGTPYNYLMDEFTFIFENPYQNLALSDFKCNPDRPTEVQNDIGSAISSNRMPFMNHFLYDSTLFNIEVPDVQNITSTNSPSTTAVGSLGQSAADCKSQYGRAPTFVLVDFFDQGPAIQTVDGLNGVTDPVGRSPVPSRSDGGGKDAVKFQKVKQLVQEVSMGQTPSLGAWIWAAGDWSWGGINLNGGNLVG